MNVNKEYQPAKYVKAKKDGSTPMPTAKRGSTLKTILAILGILVFVGGTASVLLVTKKQDTTPIAPSAPQSKPAAYIEKHETCTISFDVTAPEKLSCGETGCTTDTDCGTGLVCLSTSDLDNDNNPIKYCAKEDYEDACIDDPSVSSCCTEPEKIACGINNCETNADCEGDLICVTTEAVDSDGLNIKFCSEEDYEDACVADPSEETCCEEPDKIACGISSCETDSDCEGDLVCVTTDVVDSDGVNIKFCSEEDYEDACIDDPSEETCCEEPEETITVTTTATTTATPTQEVTTVITTVGCNESCNENADCSNISHICYEGACRLDVNPDSEQCLLPNGESTIERPVTVPTESGPEEWMQYLKAGLGTLGIGALLLLLL